MHNRLLAAIILAVVCLTTIAPQYPAKVQIAAVAWVPAVVLLLLTNAIAINFMLSRPTAVESGRSRDFYIANYSIEVNKEYLYLNEGFGAPEGPSREQAIRGLSDAIQATKQYVQHLSAGVLKPVPFAGTAFSPPPGAEKFAIDMTAAKNAMDVVLRDYRYVIDNCLVSGHVDGAPNQINCGASYDRSDPRVVNVNADVAKFAAEYQRAHTEGAQEIGSLDSFSQPPAAARTPLPAAVQEQHAISNHDAVVHRCT